MYGAWQADITIIAAQEQYRSLYCNRGPDLTTSAFATRQKHSPISALRAPAFLTASSCMNNRAFRAG
ncbi:hypothetical protein E2C01_052759 [Portunus trituberculatus]|uniref:Uncharacterized protein n=1 Tax=Portunus trituberculatus TaxID=210409 RepID=A0A5B7GEJ6_PORTR|nr:hypothetical protein [Portunus trituberculatus]